MLNCGKLILLFLGIFPFIYIKGQTVTDETNRACFNYFQYRGMDSSFDKKIDPTKEYLNPIISGFYPDPSVCRKGDDFYMVHSTFSYYPGIPIFHSKDLVNWKQIGFVLNRPSQLNLDGIRLSGGIYAPAIEYNRHNDTFYLITTCVDGIGNFLVKTKDPFENNWSDPVTLPKVGGIDPSLFFDDDGSAYIVHNDAPARVPEWEGHRAIWIHDFDVNTDKTFGERKVILDGGVDKSTRPVWIEGPHIYKIDGKYYLMAAEGGTGPNHSEVILIANNIKGEYKPYEGNPILTQRGLPESRTDAITSVGHADLIETPGGDWYAVFLGCRPYFGNYYNTGRETFLLPVMWKDGFPVILEKGEALPIVVTKDSLAPQQNTLTGNFVWKDDFNIETLDYKWTFIRTPRTEWWSLKDGAIMLNAVPQNIYEVTNPAFVGYRQQNLVFEAEIEMAFTPQSDNDLAGLVCYQNESHNFVFGKTLIDGKSALTLDRSEKNNKRIAEYIIPEQNRQNPVILKVIGDKDKYSFQASFDSGTTWIDIASGLDAKNLSTQVAGGFTGTMIGMYATSTKHSNL